MSTRPAVTDPLWVRARCSPALALLFLFAVPGGAARRGLLAGVRAGLARLPRRAGDAGHAVRRAADDDRRGARRADEHRLRRRRGVGDRALPFPGQARAGHLHRPAVRRLAGRVGPGLRAALRRPGLLRAVADRPRLQGDLRAARPGAGDAVRDRAVRRARADPADGGAGRRRGGSGALARRQHAGRCSGGSRCRRSAGACSTA